MEYLKKYSKYQKKGISENILCKILSGQLNKKVKQPHCTQNVIKPCCLAGSDEKTVAVLISSHSGLIFHSPLALETLSLLPGTNGALCLLLSPQREYAQPSHSIGYCSVVQNIVMFQHNNILQAAIVHTICEIRLPALCLLLGS